METQIVIEVSPTSIKASEGYDCNLHKENKMKIKKSLSNGIAKQQHIAKLLENWDIRPRQRTNGRYDKYYYHKETNVICRSLREVEAYEKTGVEPSQRRNSKILKKEKKKNQMENEYPSVIANGARIKKNSFKRRKISDREETETCFSSYSISDENLKKTVENFLRESYENLHNLSIVASCKE